MPEVRRESEIRRLRSRRKEQQTSELQLNDPPVVAALSFVEDSP